MAILNEETGEATLSGQGEVLPTYREENERLYEQARLLGTLQERERLARELHDNLAQALGYLSLQLSAISRLLASGQVSEAQASLRELKQIAREAYTDVREEIFSLRTGVSSGEEFLDVLRDYLDRYQTYYGLKVDLLLDEETLPEFPGDAGSQLLRIIQEALINVRKHARVTQAVIRFERYQDRACISIEDRGRGFDALQTNGHHRARFGLQIMQERVESIGGWLEVESKLDQGTRLKVWVPIAVSGE